MTLPDRLVAAGELDWSGVLKRLADAESLVTIGRGPTLAIAREAALKLKETSDLHAEAFSAGRISARAGRAGLAPLSRAHVHADRRRRHGHGRARRGSAGRRARRSSSPPREESDAGPPSGAAAGSSGDRRDLSDPELLRDGRALGREARHGRRPAAPSAQGHAHAMSAASSTRRRRGRRLRRRASRMTTAAVVIEGARIAALTRAKRPFGRRWRFSTRRPAHGSRRASSTFRSMAAATSCSTTIRRPRRSRKSSQAHRRFGVTSLLPTLITDSDEKMRAALDAVAAIMAREPGVLGIHLEGPFLSPQKPGVHRPDLIRAPQPHHREMLGAFRAGVLLVTLAPEEAPVGFIGELVAAGAKASLGHSMATYAQTRAAMAEGLDGLHASLQRHASAFRPRARTCRGRARIPRRLLRAHRRRRACRPRHAATGDARRRASACS